MANWPALSRAVPKFPNCRGPGRFRSPGESSGLRHPAVGGAMRGAGRRFGLAAGDGAAGDRRGRPCLRRSLTTSPSWWSLDRAAGGRRSCWSSWWCSQIAACESGTRGKRAFSAATTGIRPAWLPVQRGRAGSRRPATVGDSRRERGKQGLGRDRLLEMQMLRHRWHLRQTGIRKRTRSPRRVLQEAAPVADCSRP
jgi:hypothetical protein